MFHPDHQAPFDDTSNPFSVGVQVLWALNVTQFPSTLITVPKSRLFTVFVITAVITGVKKGRRAVKNQPSSPGLPRPPPEPKERRKTAGNEYE